MATNSASASIETQQSVNNTPQGIAAFFSADNFAKLQSIMYPITVKAGSHLFWENDRADRLYYVNIGMVRITKMTDEGRAFTLYLYQTGDMFGQVDPFLDSVQSFSAEAVKDSEIGVIQQKDLEVLLWQHGDLAVEFMKWMGLMRRMTETKFRDLILYGKPGALCSLLIRLSNTYGVSFGSDTRIDLKISNTEMADMIGATRESVNRMLSEMKKENVITSCNGYIVIKDRDYLRNICHCENCPQEICRM
jgi:CRP/FNR family transcriptional regulator